ncbi:uncharacterized protein YjbJ (UPF0337 family) [Bacillus sp. SORGH_AS 510]|uniref:CsbD family protein n=1 Tax=Bacillus sp. SORGH_AS_0510 TaxID=3041771 RepID=UPI0027805DD8|nr:CsbD family protein [Bacillus sp. SORGH_AS_0510]MDQ1143590.1 uncharacterized protein YjbJ (UPF0337 family) [Bacillus sp. SORGH_AS_0510]
MNKDQVKGNLEQAKGEAKEKWGKLTDDHSTEMDGKMDKAKGKVREGYGDVKDELS